MNHCSQPLEDHALIGDCETAALVGKDGCIDWWPVPRFDSGACFAALLGTPENGYFCLQPTAQQRKVHRRYRPETLVLETEWTTPEGRVRVLDFMPPRDGRIDLVRILEGVEGSVPVEMSLALRFDYGSIVPWVRRIEGGLAAIAGPDAAYLQTGVATRGEGYRTRASFTVHAGERIPFVLTWYSSIAPLPSPKDADMALESTERFWRQWSSRCSYRGRYRDAVTRSLMVLKALTYAPTGGLVAAATTSLPEAIGGPRNWDYRYCWLRDATYALGALVEGGYLEEARAWREWLVRAVAGHPSKLQIMYGLAGERRLEESELDWLKGYESSRPVRIGNDAFRQHQLDVYGEVMDTLHLGRTAGIPMDKNVWKVQLAVMDFLEGDWQQPDNGIWEMRGPSQHFTHSKVMAWVAFDRAVKSMQRFNLEGPLERWKRVRQQIHNEVCDRAFDAERGAFVQAYGSRHLDASLLMLPLVGFLPVEDPRVRGTRNAIQNELVHDGLVHRYDTSTGIDGLATGEGAFLICSFWLADNLALAGDLESAQRLFERLLSLRNDVGLLSEQYDTGARRLVGNFPQALSHLAIVNTAANLSPQGGATARRRH